VKKNIFSLLLNNSFNIILPLILIPYLVKHLGITSYGKLSFIQSLGQYFVVFVDYGHSLSAPRVIAEFRNERDKLEHWYSKYMSSRILLLIVSFPFYCLMMVLIPALHHNILETLAFYISVVAQALMPYWYLQAIEIMLPLTIASISTRIIYTISTILLVKNSENVLEAILSQSASNLLMSILLLTFINLNLKTKIRYVSFNESWNLLKLDSKLFIAQFASTIFGSSNIFILGLFANPLIVGQYAVAERVIRTAAQLTSAITTAIYPRINLLFSKNDTKEAYRIIKRVGVLWGTLIGLSCISVAIFAPSIVLFIQGNTDADSIMFLRILSFVPFFIFIENIFGTQILLSVGSDKIFLRNLVIVMLVSLIFSLIFVPLFNGLSTSIISILSQVLICLLMVVSVVNLDKFKNLSRS